MLFHLQAPLLARLFVVRSLSCLNLDPTEFGKKDSPDSFRRKQPPFGCGSNLNKRGKPQVLVHVSTYRSGSILEFRFFEPPPFPLCLTRSLSSRSCANPWFHEALVFGLGIRLVSEVLVFAITLQGVRDSFIFTGAFKHGIGGGILTGDLRKFHFW